jgi:RNA polymerase-binding transcription factor DksA
MISPETKEELLKQLREERARIDTDLDSFTREIADAPGHHETYLEPGTKEPNPEDEAYITEEYQRRKALEVILERRLEEIDAAIAAVAADRYGICRKCGAEIPEGRLRVNPTATLCMKCTR